MQRGAIQQSAKRRWEQRVRRNKVEAAGESVRHARSRGEAGRTGRVWLNVLVGVIALSASLQLVYGFATGFATYIDLRRELADVESRLADVQRANQKLSQDINYMKSPEFVEKEARRKLGLVRPGEVPVVLIQENGSQPSAPDVARRPEPPRTDKDLY